MRDADNRPTRDLRCRQLLQASVTLRLLLDRFEGPAASLASRRPGEASSSWGEMPAVGIM